MLAAAAVASEADSERPSLREDRYFGDVQAQGYLNAHDAYVPVAEEVQSGKAARKVRGDI